MSKAGRPLKKIDWDQVKKLCVIQCTLEEIAYFLDIEESTLQKRCKKDLNINFSTLFKKYADEGKISLRRSQFKVATSGNVSMLIWLGKQYLGQTDKMENTNFDKEKLDSFLDSIKPD